MRIQLLMLFVVVLLLSPMVAQEDSNLEALGEIGFVSDRDGVSQIYLMDADGNNVRRITNTNAPIWDFAWSPDGCQIAFEYQSSLHAKYDIYVVDIDGSNLRNWTEENAYIRYHNPVWSPDGRRIIFSADIVDQTTTLGILNLSDGQIRYLETPPPVSQPSGYIGDVNWLADDGHEFIVFWGYVNFTSRYISGDIYRINGSSLDAERIINDFDGIASVLSPNGDLILFQAYTGDTRFLNTFLMRSDGSGIRQLAVDIDYSIDATWSPDGRQILLVGGNDSEKLDLYQINAETDDFRNLTMTSQTNEIIAEWSLDGNQIAYVTRPDFGNDNTEIHIMSADGSEMSQLTDNIYWDSSPHWRPQVSTSSETILCP